MIKDLGSLKSRHHFYGRRKGYSLSQFRTDLINDFLPELSVNIDKPGLIAPSLLFKKNNEVWLEIGFGAGEHLADQAQRYPEISFIGCEPYINGVARLLSEIQQKSLNNILLYNDDARLLLEKLEPNSIGKVFILFSDPWPKKRHHRRRFINYENLDALSRVMKSHANIRFATDDMDFVRWALNMFYNHPSFDWLVDRPDDWQSRYMDALQTRYEKKAAERGQKCIYLTFQRCARD